MDKDTQNDASLDALFAAAKAETPAVSDDFMARLLADADSHLPEQEIAPTPRNQSPLFSNLKAIFTASGLSGAAAVGVWIGLVMPDLVTTVAPLSEDTVTLSAFLPSADLSVFSE